REGDGWSNVVQGRWVQLRQEQGLIHAETVNVQTDWNWLADYLQVGVNLAGVVGSFPRDPAMQSAVAACAGLRVFRQDPWECLAHFILSSTKQIVQIQQIVAELKLRFGERVVSAAGEVVHAFPSATRLASVSESELRDCKMGFRAPYLRDTANLVARGDCDLERLRTRSFTESRAQLLALPGVGDKIADCVLLFAYGFPQAFPVDVWVERVLRRHYWPRHRGNLRSLQSRAVEYFGPFAGYAQQYLFHHIRTQDRRLASSDVANGRAHSNRISPNTLHVLPG
ncbi:MAG: hypothetical protein EPO07_17885, partial [Verrucomicrobia bacterium]